MSSCTQAAANDRLRRNQALLRREDVLLASYPRSGNDWLRLMLADVMLQRAGADFPGGEPALHISAVVPGIYRNDLARTYRHAATVPAIDLPFLVVKTHEPFADLTERTICLVRRPADALASHFRFQAEHGDGATRDGVEAFCQGQAAAWASFVDGYLALPPGRALFVTFEAMVADTGKALARVLDFLGIAATAAETAAAIERQRIDRRRDWERRHRAVDPRLAALPTLVNEGKVGAGAAALAPETLAEIEAVAGAVYERAAARA
ncbi:MAG: sulfotransferase domain-containing protein [Alphaproteobacteria bacterium]